MARRLVRPAALRVTWLIAPWDVSATAVTLLAWAVALAAVVALAVGTTAGWLLGALLLQAWYLLDHVDGQLARLRGTASVDGAQLDYLMHHTVNLLLPVGIGWGIHASPANGVRMDDPWIGVGLLVGVCLLMQTLHHDARYKAIFKRLGRLDGRLEVIGGGGGRPTAQPPVPRSPLRLIAWLARKWGEQHVMMNLIGLVALLRWLFPDRASQLPAMLLATMAVAAPTVCLWTLARSQSRRAAETEFAAWFQNSDS